MASAAQIEAFAWWLSQSREDRTAVKIAEKLGVPLDTAEKWRAAFGRQLAKVASEAVDSHLRQYRAEYEVIQSRTLGALPLLVDGIEANARAIATMAESGGKADPELIGQTVNALKSVYSLAEAASGADVAKRRAVQPGSVASNSAPRLPDLSALFSAALPAAGVVVEPAETVVINDSGNENRDDSDETLVE
jgi:hypothetical protein